ncbi:S9 family peptidase [Egibacter rhizosphaerae]|uniref:S9 family peptidase n=1 Tax=Egibacter rhizosphaerae TaxID=1670831 RepID=A0A411YAQ5_9ACTN|nr:prolyl oligopeptidase family serine peptidase [Egibacter rhizosphaerae]QBI18258.1 S9 family peptidase [Egibacter rhizosphaerae]
MRRFRAARVSLPRWARNAPHRLVYASNAEGVWQLSSWDATTDTHRRLTDKVTGVRAGAVLPDGSGVVWFDDHDGDEVGRWVVTPFDGGPHAPLAPDVPEGWSTGLALEPDGGVVGVATRAGYEVWRLHGARTGTSADRLLVSEQPLGVDGVSADGTLVALSHTDHGDSLHPTARVVDRATGETVADPGGGDGVTEVPGPFTREMGDERLVLHSDRSGRMRPEIWQPRVGRREPLRLDLPGEVSASGWWPGGRALLLTHDHEGRSELWRYDLDAGSATRLPTRGGTVTGARVRDDGPVWYVGSSGDRQSEVRSLEDDTDHVLLAPPGERAPDGMPYTAVRYPNDEGGEVHAFLALPAGEAPFPLVVEVHGGPMAQVDDAFDPQVQAWVDHGFAVLQPNYRGSTGFGKAWEDALEGNPGRPEVADSRAGRDHLVADGIADPGQVVLTGGSWGGYVTLLGLGIAPEAWDAGVAVVPVADYLTAYEDESPDLQALDRSLFGGGPEERPELWRDRSPLTHVDAVRAPVLIITGENDTRCPRRQVDRYVDALAARGVPHEYDVFDAGHGSLAVDEQIRQTALAIDFVARHLGTSAAER